MLTLECMFVKIRTKISASLFMTLVRKSRNSHVEAPSALATSLEKVWLGSEPQILLNYPWLYIQTNCSLLAWCPCPCPIFCLLEPGKAFTRVLCCTIDVAQDRCSTVKANKIWPDITASPALTLLPHSSYKNLTATNRLVITSTNYCRILILFRELSTCINWNKL